MATKTNGGNVDDEPGTNDAGSMTKTTKIEEDKKKPSNTTPSKAAAAAAVSAVAETAASVAAAGNKPSTPNVTPPVLDSKYFYEDEIYRVNRNGHVRFGLVVETPDTYSGDEEDDDEELKLGNVRVAWYPVGNETVCSENRLGLADRTLMPGDIVRRLVPGRDTQRGFCRDIHVTADIQVLGTKYIIKNVDSKRLRPITPWLHDGAVCYNSWVGSTRDVEEKAILRSSSGARIEIPSSEFYLFRENKTHSFQNHIFFPGNIVTGRLSSMVGLKKLTPELNVPTNKKGVATFRVEALETEAVWVQWQCKALSEDPNNTANSLQQPSSTISGDELKNLKRINLFDSCMLQLNDRNYVKFAETDTVVDKRTWKKEITQTYKELWKEQRRQDKVLNESGDITVPMSNTNVIDKLKKRFNLQTDNERSGKTKKNSLKVIEKNKSKMSNLDAAKAMQQQQAAASVESDSDWVSEDCVTDEEESSSENEQKVIKVTKLNAAKTNDDKKVIASPTHAATATSTPASSPKHVIARLPYNKKQFRQLKKRSSGSLHRDVAFREGEELTTEAVLVHSTATVVWQDGTVEENIPSTSLYPINHLDNHEFFPGDYVSSGRDDFKGSFHDYGVIQRVDHVGRTAHVKWFTTYTTSDNPTPTYNGEQEMSVYDLKDHPDFQYRPGTMVIRVANFVGEDKNCTAGQVMESLIEGRLKVWWVDGHISLCWPQDLFEVGQYDQPSEEEDDEDNSDNSWETESETSEIGTDTPKMTGSEARFLIYVERARSLVDRLQEIFNKETEMECILIMRKLITLYKSCRNLDHIMNTSFFHENNFAGLVARLRKVNSQIWMERNKEQKMRMLKEPQSPTVVIELNSHSLQRITPDEYNNTNNTNVTASNSKEFAPKVVFSTASTPLKTTKSSYSDSGEFMTLQKRQLLEMARESLLNSPEGASNNVVISATVEDNSITLEAKPLNESNEAAVTTPTAVSSTPSVSLTESDTTNSSPTATTTTPTTTANNGKKSKSKTEKFQLINSAVMNLDKAAEKSVYFKKPEPAANSPQEDSGNFSRVDNCDSSSGSCGSPADAAPAATTTGTSTDVNSKLAKDNDVVSKPSSSTLVQEDLNTASLLCAKFCCIIKEQLSKCAEDVREKYVINGTAPPWSESDLHDSDKEEVHHSDAETKVENVKDSENEQEADTKEKSETTNALLTPVKAEDASVDVEAPTVGESTVAAENKAESPCVSRTASPQSFDVLPMAPKSHKFYANPINIKNSKVFMRAVMREHKILKTSMPPGVWVKIFEDRLDLLSVLIAGPKKTPYEDCMFLFDFQLGSDYPNSPPVCHYLSFCSERLNPNLYEDGKVCVSLLGTWSGRDNEVWTSKSTLLQVIVSIQGLILVPDPYFNEAGYEKQRGTQQGKENARMYNEMAVIKVVQATTKMLQNPPPLFKNIIMEHYFRNGLAMHERIKGYMELSKSANDEATGSKPGPMIVCAKYAKPEFPLIPASRGFCLTLVGVLKNLYDTLAKFVASNVPTFKDTPTVTVGTQTIEQVPAAVAATIAATAPATVAASAPIAKLATSEDDNAI